MDFFKKPTFWIILAAIVLSVVAAVCFLTDPVAKEEAPKAVFTATVVESSKTWIMVEPDYGTPERNSSNRISVSLYVHYTDGAIAATGVFGEFQVGDRVKITYDGSILESYPAQLHTVYYVELVNP